MTARRRVAPHRIGLVALVALAAALGGCRTAVSPLPSASVGPSAAAPLTPVPGSPGSTASQRQPTTSQTEFGVIWDGLPASWPKLPGQTESEIGSDASASLVVKGEPSALARALRTALEERGWTVDLGSPLEDGTIVLDATGAPDACRAQARFTPNDPGSDLGLLLVYYGAACPFD